MHIDRAAISIMTRKPGLIHFQIHSTQKVSSRLTLFDITRAIFNQNCLFKM